MNGTFSIVQPPDPDEPRPDPPQPPSTFYAVAVLDDGTVTVLSEPTAEALQRRLAAARHTFDSLVVIRGVRIAVKAGPNPAFWADGVRYGFVDVADDPPPDPEQSDISL